MWSSGRAAQGLRRSSSSSGEWKARLTPGNPVPEHQANAQGELGIYGFEAVIFNGKRTALKALDTLEDHAPAYVWIDDVAIVSRSKLGFISIYSTWAQDDRAVGAGAGWGMVTGALLGLLAGPGGALAGATAGGSMGAMIGLGSEIAFDDPRLDAFAQALERDTSALILVGEKPTLADFGSVVEPLGGKVVKTDLNGDDIAAIRKALKLPAVPA